MLVMLYEKKGSDTIKAVGKAGVIDGSGSPGVKDGDEEVFVFSIFFSILNTRRARMIWVAVCVDSKDIPISRYHDLIDRF